MLFCFVKQFTVKNLALFKKEKSLDLRLLQLFSLKQSLAIITAMLVFLFNFSFGYFFHWQIWHFVLKKKNKLVKPDAVTLLCIVS